MSRLHGIKRAGVWRYAPGWHGHAPKEIARRRRQNAVAKASRRRNRS